MHEGDYEGNGLYHVSCESCLVYLAFVLVALSFAIER